VQTRLVGLVLSHQIHPSRKISHTPEEILVKISGKTRIEDKRKEREEEKTDKA